MIFSIENLDYRNCDSLEELYQVTLEIIRLPVIIMVLSHLRLNNLKATPYGVWVRACV